MFKLERARLQYWSSGNHLWELMVLYGGFIETGHNAWGVALGVLGMGGGAEMV